MPKVWIDLQQPFHEGIPYAKIPTPTPITPISIKEIVIPVDVSPRIEARITQLNFTTHVGTHIDAARHFFADGKTIDQYPFEKFVGQGTVLDMRRDRPAEITSEDLERAHPQIEKNDIVLLYTGWAEKYFEGDSYFYHPYLGEDAANWLLKKEINIIGMDTVTLDLPIPLRKKGFNFPVHRVLLGHDILIIEHLGPKLAQVVGKRLIIGAFPIRIKGCDASPCPVFALLEE